VSAASYSGRQVYGCNSGPVLIGDAARALWRRAPMALAEVTTHALGARDASNQVTAAARKVYMHHLRFRPKCFAPFCSARGESCNRNAVSRGWWGRCPSVEWRTLTCACPFRGRNRNETLTRCALGYYECRSGNRHLNGRSSLGFDDLRLLRHTHGNRCGRFVMLSGTDRLGSDSRRVGRYLRDTVHGIGNCDHGRANGSQQELAGTEQARTRTPRRVGAQRLRHACRGG
jgi:hypothetical protein